MVFYVLFVWLVAPLVNIKENLFPFYLPVLSIIPIWGLYQIFCTINSLFFHIVGSQVFQLWDSTIQYTMS